MNDLTNKITEKIVDKVVRLLKLERNVSLELYMNNVTRPLDVEFNQNYEKVPALLKEIGNFRGITCEIKDTSKLDSKTIRMAYKTCAHWAMTTNRQSFRSLSIHNIFAGGVAGSYFGKEIPALIIYDDSFNVLCVVPVIVAEPSFSLIDYIQGRKHTREEVTIITIYDFLTRLKMKLQSQEFNLKNNTNL